MLLIYIGVVETCDERVLFIFETWESNQVSLGSSTKMSGIFEGNIIRNLLIYSYFEIVSQNKIWEIIDITYDLTNLTVVSDCLPTKFVKVVQKFLCQKTFMLYTN